MRNNLFNLKDWLTLDDAAGHLSILFRENLRVADILRLALDGHLILSVNLVNHAYARCGTVVELDDVIWSESTVIIKHWPEPESKGVKKIRPMKSLDIGGNKYLNLSSRTKVIKGVWDLPMIGNEKLHVENYYQQLIGGPAVKLIHLKGAFLSKADEEIWQLQEYASDISSSSGGIRGADQIKDSQSSKSQVLSVSKEFTEEERIRAEKKESCFFPAGGIPLDSVLVVRTESLVKFQERFHQGDKISENVTEKERESMLKMILGMAISRYGYELRAEKRQVATGSKNGSISVDLETSGLKLDTDTIRKYIKAAEDQFASQIQTKDKF